MLLAIAAPVLQKPVLWIDQLWLVKGSQRGRLKQCSCRAQRLCIALLLCSSHGSNGSKSLGQEGAFVVHAFALLCYVRVWLWHLTPAAQLLPGSTGFGWFFRYLTFYSYSWQMLQLFIACLADISKVATLATQSLTKLRLLWHAHPAVSLLLQNPVQSKFLNIWADDLSCALFGMANSVTAMYYLIDATTGKNALVEVFSCLILLPAVLLRLR